MFTLTPPADQTSLTGAFLLYYDAFDQWVRNAGDDGRRRRMYGANLDELATERVLVGHPSIWE